MDDLISREKAIEAVKDALNPNIVSFVKAKIAIENLPSAQPDSKELSFTHKALDTISRQDAIRIVDGIDTWQAGWRGDAIESMKALPTAQPETHEERTETHACDLISRQAAIDAIVAQTIGYTVDEIKAECEENIFNENGYLGGLKDAINAIEDMPSAQPDLGKYEYHYDHTDCIWYRPEARNRCPVTCSQYRDGWNDAMNYIFRDGKGYRPYRRGEQYEE